MVLREPQNTFRRRVFDVWTRPGHRTDRHAAREVRASTMSDAWPPPPRAPPGGAHTAALAESMNEGDTSCCCGSRSCASTADCSRSLALLEPRVVRSRHHRCARRRDASVQSLLVTTGHASPKRSSPSLLVAEVCRMSVPLGSGGVCAARSHGLVIRTLSTVLSCVA